VGKLTKRKAWKKRGKAKWTIRENDRGAKIPKKKDARQKGESKKGKRRMG